MGSISPPLLLSYTDILQEYVKKHDLSNMVKLQVLNLIINSKCYNASIAKFMTCALENAFLNLLNSLYNKWTKNWNLIAINDK